MANQLFGIAVVVGQISSLIDRGQKAGGPELRTNYRQPRTEHHKTGQILIFGSEPVRDPGSHGRMAGQWTAAVHAEKRRLVIRPVGVQRTDHADVIDARVELGKYLAHLDAALPVTLEAERGFQQVAGLALRLQIA